MILENFEWHTFYPNIINHESIVMDLGMNRGGFSQKMIERFHCVCYGVEPVPDLYAQIPQNDRLIVFNEAISAMSGPVQFHVSSKADASSLTPQPNENYVATITVQSKRLEEFAETLGLTTIDLVKFDIEGAEIEVLDSCSDMFLRKIGQLTIEFHDFNGTTPRSEIKRILKRLERLGFFTLRMSREGHQDTLLINQTRCGLSRRNLLWARYFVRNWLSLKRFLRRHLGGKETA